MTPNYGVDAPGAIRWLLVVAALALALAVTAIAGVLPSVAVVPLPGVRLVFPLVSTGLLMAAGFSLGAAWIYFGSKRGKIEAREKLLDRLTWRGNERVLDVGCGRGLLLVGAAKRLTTGSAVGIDIWRAADLSGNRPGAPLENAEAEGVRERVSVETADMRHLPFPDRSFDVVVSRAAIHNLSSSKDRAAAVREIARVLAPGGHAVIDDIRHLSDYAHEFGRNGCPEVEFMGSTIASLLTAVVTWGALRPNTIRVRKT
jgi:SAM-dependent methyltransferase